MAIKVNNNTVITDSRGLQDINNNLGNSVQVVGSNGTSFVWRNASEFLGIQGTQGIQGRQGIQGIAIQGIQGSNANIQGIQGRQGTQGITGTGSQGTQGVQGTQIGTGTNLQINSLGVGVAASGTAGEIRATNNITAYYTSDINLKTNINRIKDAVKKLLDIEGVYFDWKDNVIKERGGEDGYFVRKHDVGVIAQEIEKVLPEAVATREDGIKAVRYELLIPLLIESIKEQQGQINSLIEDVKVLKNNYLNK